MKHTQNLKKGLFQRKIMIPASEERVKKECGRENRMTDLRFYAIPVPEKEFPSRIRPFSVGRNYFFFCQAPFCIRYSPGLACSA